MRKTVIGICALVVLMVAGGAMAQAGGGLITLASSRQLEAGEMFAGNWEYIYDLNITDLDYLTEHGLSGFDTSGILNQWEYDPYQYEDQPQGTLVQYWSWWPANDYGDEKCFGSYSTDDATWTLHGEAWAIDNAWHVPTDYTGGSGILKAPAWFTGLVDEDNDSLAYSYRRGTGTNLTGLVMTFRIVHPNEPGPIDWWVTNKDGSAADANVFTDTGTVMGPAPESTCQGDFDDDGDVDADDLDAMGDAIRTLSTDLATYDLNDDGAIDKLDMDLLVHFGVETTVGNGTEYGDFNLDGVIDATDLTRLATNFGPGSTWAQGNANRYVDLTIDTTDLTILGTFFGFSATDAIPEPMTLSLLAVGGLAVIRRRRK